MPRLAGKVALVTGAGGMTQGTPGVGHAISVVLAEEGCRVAVVDVNEDAAVGTVDEIGRRGGESVAVVADLTVSKECEQAIDEVVRRIGAIDVLVNNLGILGNEATSDEWDRVMSVNVKSHMLTTQYALNHFSSDGGAIVNISSDSALHPPYSPTDKQLTPTVCLSAYVASKGAVISLTREMAVLYGHMGVRVNCICPGDVWTRMAKQFWIQRGLPTEKLDEVRNKRAEANLLRSEGTAWDVAHAAAFLASDDARWITGQTLVVDGGASLAKPAPAPDGV